LIVPTTQPLGRLAFYLLDPESDDGLGTWDLLAPGLQIGAPHPIARVRQGRQ
jgi:hypothetical protein